MKGVREKQTMGAKRGCVLVAVVVPDKVVEGKRESGYISKKLTFGVIVVLGMPELDEGAEFQMRTRITSVENCVGRCELRVWGSVGKSSTTMCSDWPRSTMVVYEGDPEKWLAMVS